MGPGDTICALATGALPSALALVRISSPDLSGLISSVFPDVAFQPRRATLAWFLDPASSERIDQVIAVFFPAPDSFTGEDCLEISFHGGRSVIERAMSCFTSMPNVRLAEPGEFTRRAVLNGKTDLVAAEGIADLIDAETEGQRRQALRHMSGDASARFEAWKVSLLEAMSLLDATLDFPDEGDAPDSIPSAIQSKLETLRDDLGRALQDARLGEKVRDGFIIAIVGPPNVGKSTLLNALSGRDAAIVTDIPGTTRDVIEVRLEISGQLVICKDTAGIRESLDLVEAEGIRRAQLAAETADIRLILVDSSEDRPAIPAGARDILVQTKSDLLSDPELTGVSRETVMISAHTDAGMEALVARVSMLLSEIEGSAPEPLITRQRHRIQLQAAYSDLTSALDGMSADQPVELIGEDLRRAAAALETLIGRIGVEDVLGEIFSSFCIGK